MRTAIKHIMSRTYKPWLEKYLAQTRVYRYGPLRLEVPPEVFHPGFFYSTQFLLRYLLRLPLQNAAVLELGAGSGLISLSVAARQALVTATDINPVAIRFLEKNSSKNNQAVRIIQSDLFEQVPPQQFDMIAINPPYYKKNPQSWIDHAWYCGENGEYFDRLFQQLPAYMHPQTKALMVLCDGCDLAMIHRAASPHHCRLVLVQEKQSWLEKNFIYQIIPARG